MKKITFGFDWRTEKDMFLFSLMLTAFAGLLYWFLSLKGVNIAVNSVSIFKDGEGLWSLPQTYNLPVPISRFWGLPVILVISYFVEYILVYTSKHSNNMTVGLGFGLVVGIAFGILFNVGISPVFSFPIGLALVLAVRTSFPPVVSRYFIPALALGQAFIFGFVDGYVVTLVIALLFIATAYLELALLELPRLFWKGVLWLWGLQKKEGIEVV